MASWPSKDPDEVLDYDINWGDDPVYGLGRLETGETISTSDWTIVEGSIVVDPGSAAPSILGSKTIVWLSGGVAGEHCKILNRIVTSANRTYDHTMTLRIRSH